MSLGHISEQEDFSVVTPPPDVIRLDLGCGPHKVPGFVGVDAVDAPGVDRVLDLLDMPWPWDSSAVYEIRASHFLEHLENTIPFFGECWRVLQPGGLLTIVCPYWTHIHAVRDPTHKTFVSEELFRYFSRKGRQEMGVEQYDIDADFDLCSTVYRFEPEWATRSREAQEWARRHYVNVVHEIEVVLRAIKQD